MSRSKQAPQLSAKSVEHYGPGYMGIMAREVMGEIDLDPASCLAANALIGARYIYTKEENGLLLPWVGRVYLNPPGGSLIHQGVKLNSAAFWFATLALRYRLGWVDEAIFMIFNLETLRYAQLYTEKQPLDFTVCIPLDRIDFLKPGETPGTVEEQGSPGHPNMIVYMGPNADRFQKVFSAPDASGEYRGGRCWLPAWYHEEWQI